MNTADLIREARRRGVKPSVIMGEHRGTRVPAHRGKEPSVDDAPSVAPSPSSPASETEAELVAASSAPVSSGEGPDADGVARGAGLPVPLSPRDPSLGQPPLPDWVQTFRSQQLDAVDQIQGAFEDGARVVWMQGPTGAGKTLIAELVRRQQRRRALYICSTKTLQAQFVDDYKYAAVLKGRSNYLTQSGPVDRFGQPDPLTIDSSITCADCTADGPWSTCRWCDPVISCPYREAKERAANSPLAVLNTAYALTDWNKGSKSFSNRDLVIADECDLLPRELMSHVEVNISRTRARKLGIMSPARKTAPQGEMVSPTWLPWVEEEAMPKVEKRIDQLLDPKIAPPSEIKERRSLTELLDKLRLLKAELPQGRWVYDGYQQGDIIFRPVTVDRWGEKFLWSHGRRWLCMSGSIVSAESLSAELGLDSSWRVVDLPMTFPAKNRPVYAVALVEMTHKTKDTAWPKMVDGVKGVLRHHPGERILVHTVSYALAEHLMKNLRAGHRRVVTYRNASERDAALATYKLHPGSVLIAPSMDRGVDLPHDLCRVQVICKVPWPNLGDKQTNARVYGTQGGQAWYAVQTARTILQMTGRGVRSDDDHCITYILDHLFTTNLWKKHRNLFPRWWIDGLDGRYPVQRLLKPPSL